MGGKWKEERKDVSRYMCNRGICNDAKRHYSYVIEKISVGNAAVFVVRISGGVFICSLPSFASCLSPPGLPFGRCL